MEEEGKKQALGLIVVKKEERFSRRMIKMNKKFSSISMASIILVSLLSIGRVACAEYYTLITDVSHPANGWMITANNGIPFYCIVGNNGFGFVIWIWICLI